MFKRVLSVFIIITILLSLAGCGKGEGHIFLKTDAISGYKPQSSEGSLAFENKNGLEFVCENSYLALYYNKETYNLTVFDKRSGKSYSVNPDGELAEKTNTKLAALNLIYANTQGKTGSADSYTQSVVLSQAEASVSKNGITFDREGSVFQVTYQIGYKFSHHQKSTVPDFWQAPFYRYQ